MKEFNEEELRAVLGRNPDIDVDAVIADLGRKEGQPVWPGQHVRNTVSERNSSLFPHVVSAQSFDGQLCTSNTGKGWKNPLERSKHIDGTEISAVVDLIPRNSVVDPPPRIPGASNNCVLAYGTASAQWAKADASSVREYPKLYTWWIPMPPEPYVPHGSFDEKKAE